MRYQITLGLLAGEALYIIVDTTNGFVMDSYTDAKKAIRRMNFLNNNRA